MESESAKLPSRWARIAEARGLDLPEERLERISCILDDLEAKTRAALDRDLSLVEPMFSFRPTTSAATGEGDE
ncbi:MAG: hypothetical protein GC160_00550 [Acidobacteria bacterium]|nr:hypothetical protein [Acidobacteriota bacterium]